MYANQQQSANHLYHHFSSEMFVNIIAWRTVGVPGAPKKYPPKAFCFFSRTIERYDIKFYTLITHSIR